MNINGGTPQNIIIYFDFSTVLIFGVLWIVLITYLRFKKHKDFLYLLFVTIFYAYMMKVLDYTLFQFQSLALMKYFLPGLMVKGQASGENLNLIPLIRLTSEDIVTSLLNIVLFIPFGFGLPFITKFKIVKTIVFGMVCSIAIEFLQYGIGIITKIAFRVADVNDVIFNTAGVIVGYLLFIIFLRVCRSLPKTNKITSHPIFRYIVDRPQ